MSKKDPNEPTGLQLLEETAQQLKAEFWQDQFGATVVIIGRRVYDVNDSTYKALLAETFYSRHGDVFSETTFNKHISLGVSKAVRKNPRIFPRRIHRIGNTIYYDTKEGVWEFKAGEYYVYTADDPEVPVIFRRYSDSLDAPIERTEETPKELIEKITNQYNHNGLHWTFIASFFEPTHSHPIGLFNGDPGAAKSTIACMIKSLVDPSIADKITIPENVAEFDTYREKFYVCNYDNVRKIEAEQADELCRQVTGSASVKRKLYTDSGLYLSTGKPRILLNGVKPEPSAFNDLLDRFYPVFMRKLEKNRNEEEVNKEILFALPKIRFACLKQISLALLKPIEEFEDLPRMAEFSMLCEQLNILTGGTKGEFIKHYREKISVSHAAGLDDAFASVLIEYIDAHKNSEMRYSALEWYQKIKEWAEQTIQEDQGNGNYARTVFIRPEIEMIVKDKDFLKNPVAIGRRFRELNNLLEAQGYNINYYRTNQKNIIEVKKK
jgi:hypothetical protein